LKNKKLFLLTLILLEFEDVLFLQGIEEFTQHRNVEVEVVF
jgi:hypothetical protein